MNYRRMDQVVFWIVIVCVLAIFVGLIVGCSGGSIYEPDCGDPFNACPTQFDSVFPLEVPMVKP